jgi:tRNA threonylcarbamoyl adenosine modification protein YeaZ
VLVLALDTATDAVVVGLARLAPGGEPEVLAEQLRPGARQHGEQLMPAVLDVCASAGVALPELDAVVCGIGPGPFTGLRVGMVSAAGLGDALGVPVHGVVTLDAVARRHPGEPLLVVGDARRRELYWAAYAADGTRTEGPAVDAPAALAARVPELGVRAVAGPVATAYAEQLGLPAATPVDQGPSVSGLVAVALPLLGTEPAPLEPCYLRRPDAVPPGERKRVSA